MRLVLLAALGGAIGTVARYLTVTAAAQALGTEFPWGTLGVNVAGSLVIGALMAAIGTWYDGSPELRVLLVTGFLGGFTTFSAFSFELLLMVQRRAYLAALLYVVSSVLLSLLAVAIGFSTVKTIAQ
jgi:fluoride exporter